MHILLKYLFWAVLFSSTVVNGAKADHSAFHIKIVYADSWKPVSYEENRRVKGLLPDAIDSILSNYKVIEVEHVAVPWARAQQMVKSGQADGMITTPTDDRLSYTYRSESSVFLLPFVLASNTAATEMDDFDDVDDLNQFTGKTFCDVLGNSWADNFYKDQPVNVHTVPTIKQCLKLLAAGRVIGVIHAQPVLELYIKELGLEDKIRIHQWPSLHSPTFPLLISKQNPKAKDILASFDKHFYEDHNTVYLGPLD